MVLSASSFRIYGCSFSHATSFLSDSCRLYDCQQRSDTGGRIFNEYLLRNGSKLHFLSFVLVLR